MCTVCICLLVLDDPLTQIFSRQTHISFMGSSRLFYKTGILVSSTFDGIIILRTTNSAIISHYYYCILEVIKLIFDSFSPFWKIIIIYEHGGSQLLSSQFVLFFVE